jgi:hypothetical protein
MSILQFLSEKFDNFTYSEAERTFNDITNYLPNAYQDGQTYVSRILYGPFKDFARNLPVSNPVWGYCDDGLWSMTESKIYLYQDDGSVHLLGFKFDQTQFDYYQTLQQSELIRTLIPTEITQLSVTSNDHASGNPPDTPMWYVKFSSPNNTVNIPAEYWVNYSDSHTFSLEKNIKFVDILTDLLSALKANNLPYPAHVARLFSFDEDGAYLINDCTFDNTDYSELIDKWWLPIVNKTVDDSNKTNVLNYAREKWQPFTI